MLNLSFFFAGTENKDDRQINLTIFLDLKKAFDTVDHSIFSKSYTRTGSEIKQGNGLNLIWKTGRSFAL